MLLRGRVEVARWPLAAVASRPGPDLGVVGRLARLQLAALRMGCTIEVRNAGAELVGLLDLVGLAGLLGEVGRQAEEGEQVRVEEVVMPDDTVA